MRILFTDPNKSAMSTILVFYFIILINTEVFFAYYFGI